MGTPQVIQTGAGIRLSINGTVVGFATGIAWTRSLNTKVIYEIDNPFPAEIAPTTYLVQGTLTGIRLKASTSAGLDARGIMNASTARAFFNQKYCVVEVIDIASGKSMFSFFSVVFDQDSWNISSRAIITFNANFKGNFMNTEASV